MWCTRFKHLKFKMNSKKEPCSRWIAMKQNSFCISKGLLHSSSQRWWGLLWSVFLVSWVLRLQYWPALTSAMRSIRMPAEDGMDAPVINKSFATGLPAMDDEHDEPTKNCCLPSHPQELLWRRTSIYEARLLLPLSQNLQSRNKGTWAAPGKCPAILGAIREWQPCFPLI